MAEVLNASQCQPEVQREEPLEGPSTSSPRASKLSSSAMRADLMAHIRGLAESFQPKPEIYKRRRVGEPDTAQELGVSVPDWAEVRRQKDLAALQGYGGLALQPSTFVPTSSAMPALTAPAPAAAPAAAGNGGGGGSGRGGGATSRAATKVTKACKHKSGSRTYTSKYRGVHQTFPTRRWEAQFRRNGKPTSLGCFDLEEQAARAYDKMMLWCELHNATGVKGGITNFDASEYEADMPFLQQVTQDDLVQMLRSDGRRQAAQRMLKQKREGQQQYNSGDQDSD